MGGLHVDAGRPGGPVRPSWRRERAPCAPASPCRGGGAGASSSSPARAGFNRRVSVGVGAAVVAGGGGSGDRRRDRGLRGGASLRRFGAGFLGWLRLRLCCCGGGRPSAARRSLFLRRGAWPQPLGGLPCGDLSRADSFLFAAAGLFGRGENGNLLLLAALDVRRAASRFCSSSTRWRVASSPAVSARPAPGLGARWRGRSAGNARNDRRRRRGGRREGLPLLAYFDLHFF